VALNVRRKPGWINTSVCRIVLLVDVIVVVPVVANKQEQALEIRAGEFADGTAVHELARIEPMAVTAARLTNTVFVVVNVSRTPGTVEVIVDFSVVVMVWAFGVEVVADTIVAVLVPGKDDI
jgi:hypothetical protein